MILSDENDRTPQIRRLVDDIRMHAWSSGSHTGRPQLSGPVMDAMAAVPRDRFVPEAMRNEAFADHALAIGHGQTISQPFIVALMTDLLDPTPTARVLEIGTGSGYQAAVLAQLAAEVHTVEIIPALAQRTTDLLATLGIDNVFVHQADGSFGWAAAAPYDGILVTAAAPKLPARLLDQLHQTGRLVIPLGHRFGFQELFVIQRGVNGQLVETSVLPVVFVPFTGAAG